jgi:hypothetical protein
MPDEKLIKKTKAELLEMLKAKGLKAPPRATKQEIVEMLRARGKSTAKPARKKAATARKTATAAKPAAKKKAPAAEKPDPKKAAPTKKAPRATKPKVAAAAPTPPEPEPVRVAQQRVEETKYATDTRRPAVPRKPAAAAASSPPIREEAPEQAWPAELPRRYGVDRIVAMVRDPYWLFVYWETTPEGIDRARRELGGDGDGARTVLRIYDTTGITFTGANAHSHFDIEVGADPDNWYINTGWPDKSYCIDIGLLAPSGEFRTVARSNAVHTPRAGMSDEVDERWMSLEEEFERMYALSGGFQVGGASAELREMMERQLQMQLGSEAVGSLFSMAVTQRKARGFRLEMNAELIIYGATEPDASLTIQGKPVTLRPDGTFSARFALPDGTQDIPVTACSADGVEERTISLGVTSATARREPVLRQ